MYPNPKPMSKYDKIQHFGFETGSNNQGKQVKNKILLGLESNSFSKQACKL